jgi:hypothetical protein
MLGKYADLIVSLKETIKYGTCRYTESKIDKD